MSASTGRSARATLLFAEALALPTGWEDAIPADLAGGPGIRKRLLSDDLLLVTRAHRRHVRPRLAIRRDAAIARHRARSRVVRREGKIEIAVERVEQLPEVPRPAEDVLAGIEHVADAEELRGGRHQLHQARCADARDCIRIPGGLTSRHRRDVPYRVVINEAIETAKRFGAEHGHTYVNGVLDHAAAEWRSLEVQAPRAR